MTLPCGHPMSDIEKTRFFHGASQLWCSFCCVWEDVDEGSVGEQTALFDQDREGGEDG